VTFRKLPSRSWCTSVCSEYYQQAIDTKLSLAATVAALDVDGTLVVTEYENAPTKTDSLIQYLLNGDGKSAGGRRRQAA